MTLNQFSGAEDFETGSYEFGRSWFKRQMSHAGHFISNTVKSAGREIGKAGQAIQDIEGKVSSAIAKIPVVGAPLKTVFDAAYHATVGPLVMTSQIAAGRRVDRAILSHLKDLGRDAKGVAPLAQTIVSFIPAVGTGISAALGAGLALAEGQPLDKVAEAAVSGAIPGGPVAVAVYHVASNGIKAAATGKKFDFADAAKEAASGALQTLGLPPTATHALEAGVDAAGKIAHGEPLDKALTSSAVSALPIPDSAKNALHEATDISISLAHGARVDKTLLQHIGNVTSMLPILQDAKEHILTAVKTGKSLVEGAPLDKSLGIALHAAIGDTLIAHVTRGLPKTHIDALKTGLATGAAVVHQAHTSTQLGQIHNKLIEAGIQLAKAVPPVAEGRKLAGAGVKGFDHAMGLLSHEVNAFDVIHARSLHDGPDKLGFDMALSLKNGLVNHPIPAHLSPAAVAGHAIAHGASGMPADNHDALVKVVTSHPSADVGAKLAIQNIQARRENIIARVFYAIGFR